METEIERSFDPSESFLPHSASEILASDLLTCHGIESDVLTFIAENVHDTSRTLETGAGCSTLVFALRGCEHMAVTPSQSEISLITRYAVRNEICLGKVRFVPESSEKYLPRCEMDGLDLVLLDGKHAFPWPMLDWFYTADKLRKGGLMVIDDVQLRSVAILTEFMSVDPGWRLVENFSGKTHVFEKVRDSVHDVAWHMQPYNRAEATPPVAPIKKATLLRRLMGKVGR